MLDNELRLAEEREESELAAKVGQLKLEREEAYVKKLAALLERK